MSAGLPRTHGTNHPVDAVKPQMHFVYSPEYYCDIGPHVFPTAKFRLTYEALLAEGRVGGKRMFEPEPIGAADLGLVHTSEYLSDLFNYSHSPRTISSELPISKQIVDAHLLATGGTLLAARSALEAGAAMNLNGGFHHAFPDRAEGFCYVNDCAVAVRTLQREGRIGRAAVVDCDLHQGNGTAFIFKGDPTVFTFSIHQERLYPIKQKSDLDIGLDERTGDEEYLAHIREHVPRILDSHEPDLVFYLAGADPYREDQLGDLGLTIEGLRARDQLVAEACAARGIPLAAVMAGGYARDTRDTVQIHLNTCHVLLDIEHSGCVDART